MAHHQLRAAARARANPGARAPVFGFVKGGGGR